MTVMGKVVSTRVATRMVAGFMVTCVAEAPIFSDIFCRYSIYSVIRAMMLCRVTRLLDFV